MPNTRVNYNEAYGKKNQQEYKKNKHFYHRFNLQKILLKIYCSSSTGYRTATYCTALKVNSDQCCGDGNFSVGSEAGYGSRGRGFSQKFS